MRKIDILEESINAIDNLSEVANTSVYEDLIVKLRTERDGLVSQTEVDDKLERMRVLSEMQRHIDWDQREQHEFCGLFDWLDRHLCEGAILPEDWQKDEA